MAEGSKPRPTADEVADVFHVDDPEIDVGRLVDQIAARLAERGDLPADPEALLKEFGRPTLPSPVEEMTYGIERLSALLRERPPADRLRPATTPIGKALDMVRRPVHSLVRYYVDPHAERQEELARWVTAVLGAIAKSQGGAGAPRLAEALAQDLAALRAEVAALRAEVEALRREKDAAAPPR